MKKTVNVNLAGMAYIIDEDAYNMLSAYLNDIHSAFANTECGDEISSDIEGRVAELLCEKVRDRNLEVVDIKIVNEIIERIGRAEEYSTEEKSTACHENAEAENETINITPPAYEHRPKKRLYRNPSDSLLGGVCSGLAQYLGIDVAWIRLMFVALTIISASTWILVYIVMWICVPEANTAHDYFAMKGESATLCGIGEHVQNKWEMPAATTEKKSMLDVIFSIMATLAKALLLVLAIIGAPVLVALGAALVACLIALLFGAFGFTPLSQFEIIDGQGIIAIICGIFYILFVGIPLLFVIVWILKSVAGARLNLPHSLKVTLLVVWIVSLIAAPLATVALI